MHNKLIQTIKKTIPLSENDIELCIQYFEHVILPKNLECITDCEVLRITKTVLDFVIEQSIALKNFSIQVFQDSLAYNENRSRELAFALSERCGNVFWFTTEF